MEQLSYELKVKVIKSFITVLIIILFTVIMMFLLNYFNLVSKPYYKASDFGIKVIYSKSDFDKDKIDDYSDILLGARKDAKNKPEYVNEYYENAYPPDNEGNSADVMWRALKNAGYSLRDMIDNDIKNNKSDYPDIIDRDNNVDFRRVDNLEIFFKKYCVNLTMNYKDIKEWQAGDIVFFEENYIGIVSDKRNSDGVSYVIHNSGQKNREEDILSNVKIYGHYRFDATLIDSSVLFKWND